MGRLFAVHGIRGFDGSLTHTHCHACSSEVTSKNQTNFEVSQLQTAKKQFKRCYGKNN